MLKNKLNMLNKNWKIFDLSITNSSKIPNKSGGVYLIVKLRSRVSNVPIGAEVLYVGKASKSIRSRFLKYTNILSHHNNDLLSHFQSSNLEFWYIELNQEQVDFYETFLILEMKKFNSNFTNKIIRKFKTTKAA